MHSMRLDASEKIVSLGEAEVYIDVRSTEQVRQTRLLGRACRHVFSGHQSLNDMSDIKSVAPVAVSDTTSDLDKNAKDMTPVNAAEAIPEQPSSRWRKIVGLVWDSVDGDPEYRKYVQRLDTFFL